MKIKLGYGLEELELEIPEDRFGGIYSPREKPGVKDVQGEVERALENPLGSRPLREIARKGGKVAIVIDDLTRDVPTSQILPPLLSELFRGGIKEEDVTVVVALGIHRRLNEEELRSLLGEVKVKIINHEPRDKEKLTFLGKTSLGTEVYINRFVAEADIKILTGDVEYHQFFGYGGGAKSVFPGIADAQSIELSHSRMEFAGAEIGRIEGNPVREEAEEVGEMLGVDFILNVVLNSKKEVVKAFAGDLKEAFLKGTALCDQMYKVRVPQRADVVIASAGGYPRDINLYQSQKAIESATRVVKKRGKIILFAQCREGVGSDLCIKWMKEAKSIEEIFERIRKKFVIGGHKAYQLVREIKWAEVHLFSSLDSQLVKEFFIHPLSEPGEVSELVARGEKVIILPQATLTFTQAGN